MPLVTEGSKFGICPLGYYCPIGTAEPLSCPDGFLIAKEGARSVNECDLCSGGKYCPNDRKPVIEIPCLIGHYCPYGRENSSIPIPCPEGTYSDTEGNDSLLGCLICPSRYNCNATGISDLPSHKCPEGYYCPRGTGAVSSSIEHLPVACPEGTFGSRQELESIDECTPCPSGFYCPNQGMKRDDRELFRCQPGTLCPL